MATVRWALCVGALLWPSLVFGATPRLPSSVPRLRPLGDRASDLLARSLSHSPTVRSLAAHLGKSDVVVYIEIAPRPAGTSAGATRFVGASPVLRFLHVRLDAALPTRALMPLLAHELQHAVEIADARAVRDAEAFRAYYAHSHDAVSGATGVCSRSARRTAERVREEIAETDSNLSAGLAGVDEQGGPSVWR
jgi:hypothetical protein